jgi:hypothetical protein
MSTITFIGKEYTLPNIPKFLFAPDQVSMQLYIIHLQPFALIWVCQATPAQLFIIDGAQDENILRDAAEFYKNHVNNNFPNN